MRWSDLLNPEKLLAMLFKLLAVFFVLLFVLQFLLTTDGAVFLVLLSLAAVVAYLIREQRSKEGSRPRSTRGAERTQLLPRWRRNE